VAAVVAFLASPRSVAINGDAIAAGGGSPRAIHYWKVAAGLPFGRASARLDLGTDRL